MKKLHLLSLVILFFAVITFSSCLDSDNESNYDDVDYMTLKGFMGSQTLVCDHSDYVYHPINPNVLELVDEEGNATGEYLERGLIFIKAAEGEIFPQEGKTEYKVSIVGVQYILNVLNIEDKPEVIENSNPFYKLGADFWAAKGYINISFSPTIEKVGEKIDIEKFDLYLDRVEDNTLILRLNHSIAPIENPYYSEQLALVSYKLPSKYEVQSKFPELKFDEKNNIKIKIIALGQSEKELETKVIQTLLPSY